MSTIYTQQDAEDAPPGHVPLVGTDVEIVGYPGNQRDLMLLVNKGGVCVFRVILAGALRNDLDLQRANTFMTEQRIVLGEPPQALLEIVQFLKREA